MCFVITEKKIKSLIPIILILSNCKHLGITFYQIDFHLCVSFILTNSGTRQKRVTTYGTEIFHGSILNCIKT